MLFKCIKRSRMPSTCQRPLFLIININISYTAATTVPSPLRQSRAYLINTIWPMGHLPRRPPRRRPPSPQPSQPTRPLLLLCLPPSHISHSTSTTVSACRSSAARVAHTAASASTQACPLHKRHRCRCRRHRHRLNCSSNHQQR